MPPIDSAPAPLRRLLPVAAGTAAFLVFPLVVPSPYVLHIMILCFISAIYVGSWNILFGYMGVYCFGQQAFFGIGAYASALLVVKAGAPIFVAVVAGGLVAVLSSLVVALPTLRLKGAYVALVTLAFAEVVRIACSNWIEFTRGQLGLSVPPFFAGGDRRAAYYLSVAFFLVATAIFHRLAHSSFGAVAIAIRDSQEAAESLGVNVAKYKLLAFVVSSFFTGIAGTLYAHYIQILTPEVMALSNIVDVLVFGVFGGLGTVAGPVLGTFVLKFVAEYTRFLEEFRFVIYGLIIIFSIMFMPAGLVGKLSALARRLPRTAYPPGRQPALGKMEP